MLLMMMMVRIIMTVVMKMALVEKCNKGPQCWRKKQFSGNNFFSRTLRTKLLPQDGCFDNR